MSRSTGGLTASGSPTRLVGVVPGGGADEPFHRGPNGTPFAYAFGWR